MAKSGRHKKLRKQEKAKTQLKGNKNKVLAKAQNVVQPTIRSKKILIREQLKSSSSSSIAPAATSGRNLDDSDNEIIDVTNLRDSSQVTTTRRKQTLQEVFTSLNHHNKNIKKDALNGLIEIITSQSNLLITNLDRILEKLGALTSDLESIVRKENLRVSEIVFAQINEDQVQPFWNLLLTHVKCTLTNLNPTIRYSCLSFMTLLINYFPNLISKSIHIILPNLLGLISTSGSVFQSSSSSKPVVGQDQKAKLKIEISDKHSDSKERLRVLSLITSCLDLSKLKETVVAPNNSNFLNQTNLRGLDSSTSHCQSYDNIDDSNLYFPYGYQEYQKNSQSSGFSFDEFSKSAEANSVFSKDNSNFWHQFIQSCLPILWETWLEIRPSLKDSSDRSNVNSGGKLGKHNHDARGVSSLPTTSVEYLECIVTLMSRLILQHSSQNANATNDSSIEDVEIDLIRFLRKSHGQSLKKYFFNWLPFSAVQDTQRKMLTSINLELYHIASQLRLVDENLMSSLETYVRVLMSKSILDSNLTSKVLKILILIHMERAGSLMSEVINYALDSEHYESVNGFLLEALTLTTKNMNSDENFILRAIDWDNVVDQLLVQSSTINSQALNILTLVGLRKLVTFSEQLKKNFEKLQNYINQENSSTQAWDQVVRLFYVLNSLEYFEKITVPETIQDVINQLHKSCA